MSLSLYIYIFISTILFTIILQYTTFYCIRKEHVMLCHIIPYHITLYYIILYYIILCYIRLYDTRSYKCIVNISDRTLVSAFRGSFGRCWGSRQLGACRAPSCQSRRPFKFSTAGPPFQARRQGFLKILNLNT